MMLPIARYETTNDSIGAIVFLKRLAMLDHKYHGSNKAVLTESFIRYRFKESNDVGRL
jgi:hypothetical protein